MVAALPNLHDAILHTVVIDWETAVARCNLNVWFGSPLADPSAEMLPITVTLTGLKGATIPRGEPWGPSIYVNSGELRKDEGAVEFWLEMQSGDEIVVRAAAAEVTPSSR
ncbi:MAG TPA: hypothetical protein VFI18_09525 [Gaiellales bacterium]|nr:hypothetical protein [Gaiellales bacterium]